jgi:ribulose-phosphate 3-epimerase
MKKQINHHDIIEYMNHTIYPSILSASYLDIEKELQWCANKLSTVHIDIMDGHYVPVITMGEGLLQSIHRRYPIFQQDVHLMVSNTEQVIDSYLKYNLYRLHIHPATCYHPHRVIQTIKNAGTQASIVLNPHESVDSIVPLMPYIDSVLIMGVNPGYSGQEHIQETTIRIKTIYDCKIKNNFTFFIIVDGGCTTQNIPILQKAGADYFVMGSAFFKSTEDQRSAILKQLFS